MEPETVVIKVKYGDTLRRFITPVINQELDLNMDRLRDKICYFFKFSPETDFTLTYIDEDDDLVGLVDDEDLRDIVRQALNPVRITVKVNAEKLSKSRGQSSGRSSPQILKPDTSEALKSVPAEAVDALMKTKKAFEDPSLGGKEALPNPESEKLQPVREIVERQLDAHEEAYKGNLPQDMREVKKKKSSEDDQKGYIHVRARRGQATDSHSLAERVRREKISARMRALQALVPGCDKITGKALMLDEIINYVQSLQNQVEFLSMKLTSVNPMFYDFGTDRLGCFRTST